MDGERVAQVMQPWLKATAVIPPNAGTITGKAKVVPKGVVIHLGAIACREERPHRCRSTARVLGQSTPQVRPERDEACFAELGLPNGQQRFLQVHVAAIQMDCLADAKAGAIKEQQHGAHGHRIDGRLRVRVRFRRSQQPTEFVVRVDVRDESWRLPGNRQGQRRHRHMAAAGRMRSLFCRPSWIFCLFTRFMKLNECSPKASPS